MGSLNDKRKDLGEKGESFARELVIEQGWKILEHNWRGKNRCELDIIAEDIEFLRIVEVRTLTAPAVVEPYQTVGLIKQRHIIKAAKEYMRVKKVKKEVVFDIVSVVVSEEENRIELIKNAFMCSW